MIPKNYYLNILLGIVLVCFVNNPFAADVQKWEPYSDLSDFNWVHFIIIDGTIEKGDFKKVKQLFDSTIKSNCIVSGVCLSSNGGDVEEAMLIGNLIRANYISTFAPIKKTDCNSCYWDNDRKNCFCDSSCFLIWVAGVNRLGDVLGLHRPYFGKEYFKNLNASDAKEKFNEMSDVVKTYLLNMDVPVGIIDEMYKYSSNNIHYLDESIIESLRYAPFFDEWIIANCGKLTPKEENDYERYKYYGKIKKLSDAEKFYFNHLSEKRKEINRCRVNKVKKIQLGDN